MKTAPKLLDSIPLPALLTFILKAAGLQESVFRALMRRVCGETVPEWFSRVPTPALQLEAGVVLVFPLARNPVEELRLVYVSDRRWKVIYNLGEFGVRSEELYVEQACVLALSILQRHLG